MTSTARRARYRKDPAFRETILESNRRSRERHASPYRKQMDALASEICRVRDSLDARMLHAARLEKRLLGLLAKREELRKRVQ